MPGFLKFLSFLSLCSVSFAHPQAVDAADKCVPTMTYTAKFDALPTGAGVPNDKPLPGISWSGFTVDTASKYIYKASSGANVAVSDFTGGSFAFNNLVNQLVSFDFSCSYYFTKSSSYYPEDCSILIITHPYGDYYNPIASLGPFTAGFDCGGSTCGPKNRSNMTTVTAEMLGSSIYQSLFNFYVTAGQFETQILLDNVVFTALNPKCSN